MRSQILSVLTLAYLLIPAYASWNNASLDSRSLDSETFDTILIAKSTPFSPMSILRRAFFGSDKILSRRQECPQVWYDLAVDFRRDFGGCSRRASSAIRFAFHDSGGYSSKNSPYEPASGGADGSLLLSDVEIAREDHNPMQGFREYMWNKWQTYKDQGVGAADFVQAAGNIGIHSCQGGPVVKTLVGREDSSEPSPEGTLPAAFGAGADHASLMQLFADKGITPRELAALMGAHTTSRSFANTKNGMAYARPQDTTPQSWDNKYYSETQAAYGQASGNSSEMGSFESDRNMANPSTTVGEFYTEFAGDQAAWTIAFQDSMLKLSLLGLSEDKVAGLIDCTDILTS